MPADVTMLLPQPIDDLLFYQRYYVMGFERVGAIRLSPRPWLSRLPGDRSGQLAWLIRIHARLRRLAGRRAAADAWPVGQYLVATPRGQIKVVIDAFDNHRAMRPAMVEWTDVYFKANYWPSAAYDARVRPIVNGNGMLGPRDLDAARALRATPKEIDVTFISNVWGGREHNVRLFESLARLECRKDLLAIFPGGVRDEETRALAARLEAAGVATSARSVPRARLWRALARSRLVMFRSGVHGCMPWRTIDLLCMGACIVLDAVPLPQWPVPLRPDVHYASCGIARSDSGVPEPGEYAKVGETIARLLARPAEQEGLRREAAAYYDAHAAPERVARYVLDTVAARG